MISDDLVQKCKDIDASVQDSILRIKQLEKSNMIPFKLTTMTVLVVLNCTFSFEKFKEYLQTQAQEEELLSGWTVNCSPGFYNCIMFSYKGKSNKIGVKLFRNGKLHLTGLKSTVDAVEYSKTICKVLAKYTQLEVLIQDIDIHLINGSTKIVFEKNNCLCLQKLYYYMLSEEKTELQEYTCVFNNDDHPGLRLKNKPMTVMVFEGGSLLFQSFRSGEQLYRCYTEVLKFLMGYMEKLVKQKVFNPRKRKKQFDYKSYL